jgi:phage shock protein E
MPECRLMDKPVITRKITCPMISLLRKLFTSTPQVDYKVLVKEGAAIVDVRTKGEYQSGHIKESLNIPLDTLRNNLAKLAKEKPVITCCASGMRSASAKRVLKANGFERVYNGGSWISLQNKIK